MIRGSCLCDSFRYTEMISSYRSSPGVMRTFCKGCGTTLQFITEADPGSFALAVGTLDDDPGTRPVRHIFTGSKAPWYAITDELPRHANYP